MHFASEFRVCRILAMYEEQVRLSKGREAFALLFGHEAQAPAADIRGTADRLLMKIRRKEIDEQKTLGLVQDIIDFSELIISFSESLTFGFGSRANPSRSRLNPRLVNLRGPIESAKRVVRPICRYELLSYDAIKISGTFPDLYVDQKAIMRVFCNLLTNAIKYRRRGPTEEFKVLLRCAYHDSIEIPSAFVPPFSRKGATYTHISGYLIEVADYGMGVEPAHTRKIFAEGFRAPEIGKYEIRGSGIGLSVVLSIMNSIGGAVWLSQIKNPTVFSMVFPVQLTDRRAAENILRGVVI